MKSIEVTIESQAPFLMNHRPMDESDEAKKKTDVYDPKIDAERKSHFDPKAGYYVPSDMLEACWREAGKNIKNGRASSKKLVMASMFVDQEKVSLGRKDYDAIDKRWGTHPSTGNSVLVSRLRFDRWKVSFTINYDESRITPKRVKEIIQEGGSVIGIGSYRPKFGRYKVTSFDAGDE